MKTIKKTIALSVRDYLKAAPEIDFLHVWLADDRNNHCECSECIKKRPSDWYIDLLNAIDDELTKEGLAAKIVFLIKITVGVFKCRDRVEVSYVLLFRDRNYPTVGGVYFVHGNKKLHKPWNSQIQDSLTSFLNVYSYREHSYLYKGLF